ncbi:MAG TPA: tetratricopeptide repeat protein [Candidatus Sulfotelmatobacter sp.]|nr:tetratricopeptide repeat protein [Candidatus Sulfotelmatobacter sp.]
MKLQLLAAVRPRMNLTALPSQTRSIAQRSHWLRAALLVAAAAFAVAAPPRAAAQMDGSLSGNVLDVAGKPWADQTIDAVSDQGAKLTTKTDKDGNYAFHNLRAGVYSLTVELPAPNKPYEFAQVKVSSGEGPKVNVNFKDVVAKQGAAAQEQMKKQEEDKQKFAGMKQHFEAGIADLTQAQTAKADMAKAPADQRDTMKAQVTDLSGKAVTELEAAKAAAPEKDANLHLIWARLGDAYDVAGRPDDAANAYRQAAALKPTPGYYNNLGGILGRAGKIDEAMAAYQKSAELDPPNAAQAYRNAGITLYNAGKMKEAVEPLKKATELDPKSAQAWYLLGASLVGAMEYKQKGDKMEVVVQPGTVEAYQKAVELDPNGPYGQQAKQGLEALAQIAPGIDTKTKTGKKKS